jgi:hypothetical protein
MNYPSEKGLDHEIDLIEEDENMTDTEKAKKIRELQREFRDAIEEFEEEERNERRGQN